MTRFGRFCLAAAALLLVLFLVACNGDDDGDGNGDGQPTATEAADDGETDGDGNGAPDGDADGDGETGLDAFLEEYGDREFKIVYSFSGTDVDAGTMTFYWKPDGRWRVDFAAGGDEGSVINAGDVSYICTPEDGGMCLESPLGGSAIPFPFFGAFTDPGELETFVGANLGGLDYDRSEREIAGVDATCLSASGEVEGEQGQVEICFGDGYMLLFRGGDATGQVTLEATSVETSVPDSDLEPPYEITEIPGLDDIPDSP